MAGEMIMSAEVVEKLLDGRRGTTVGGVPLRRKNYHRAVEPEDAVQRRIQVIEIEITATFPNTKADFPCFARLYFKAVAYLTRDAGNTEPVYLRQTVRY